MSYAAHGRDFGLSGDRTAPVANGIGAKLARLARRLSDAPAAQRQREVDREIALRPGALGRTNDGQHGARNDGEGSGVRLEPAAVAASSKPETTSHCRVHSDGVPRSARPFR